MFIKTNPNRKRPNGDLFKIFKSRFGSGTDFRLKGFSSSMKLQSFTIGFIEAPQPVSESDVSTILKKALLRPPTFRETMTFIFVHGDRTKLMFDEETFGPTILFFHKTVRTCDPNSAYITSLRLSNDEQGVQSDISLFDVVGGLGMIYPMDSNKPYQLAGIQI